MKRRATAVWNGAGKDGKGALTTQSTVLNNTQYSFSTRFADGVGTNPEELIAAAHAGCFSMKLSFVLGEAGFYSRRAENRLYNNIRKRQNNRSRFRNLRPEYPALARANSLLLRQMLKQTALFSQLLNTNIELEAAATG